ncbi:hypothetical protein GCM10023115_25280 [Pontixanthobacter gangjinensis]|uniref:Glycosyltransferase family 4 protein n=1 Tax=Christiangramia aestuarii TaxID=1028746 RepID=A0A7M3SYT2_9FLAO|nr:glycosyltransferase family 4 protein [Christiangramia aestuarii]MUP41763.1 glycosyltransferase family 4 protein [Christiangramia aestuarii]
MRRILYIGNKLEKHGAAPTSIDTLPKALNSSPIYFKTVSSFKPKLIRLLHMLFAVIKNAKSKDLVLIDTYSTTNFWYAVSCGYLCKALFIPYVFILHGGNLEDRLNRSSKAILDIFRNARANVVPSEFLRIKLEKFGFSNMQIIPNSIEISDYKFTQRDGLKPKILWVRAFDKVYNPHMAIELVQILKQKFPQIELCMVGPDKDGSLSELKKMVSEKKLPVSFTGKLSKQDWINLSENFDIFINTTTVDNTPVSLIEAMALGLPVVSTNVGGVPYLIEDGKTGLLVDSHDTAAMAKAVESLIENPELAKNISMNARQKVESYDWEQVKPLWLELLG